jgi:glycosyltransferase involved in cell wall biosynthesis
MADKTIRALHLVNGEHFAGVERMVLTLAARDRTVKPSIVCLMDGKVAPLIPPDIDAAVAPMRSRLDFRAVLAVCRKIRSGDIDIVHAHTLRANLVAAAACALTSRPLVVSIHSPACRESTQSFKNAFNSWVENRLIRRAQAYVAVSEHLAKEMIGKGVPKEKISVVRNGIDTGCYESASGDAFRAELGVQKDSVLVGAVALLRPRKGIERMLRTIVRLKDSAPNARFVIVGDSQTPNYRNDLIRLSQELNIESRLAFIPFRLDIPCIMNALDILVFPSLYGEGLPLAILEAMAAGTPVIASRSEGIVEAVLEDVTGLLFDAGDDESLASCLRTLIFNRSRRIEMGKRGRERVHQLFSADRMAAQIKRVYRRVLEGRAHETP